MVEIGLSDRVTFLGGVRYEGTEVDGIGHELHFNEDGDHSGTFPTRTSGSYDDFLPQLHLVYAIDDNTNLRIAATQSIARPRYFDIVPHQRTNFEDDRIDRGNSDLKRTIGTSFDVLFERYFPGSIGVISAGVFYKDLDDPIVSITSQEVIDGEVWDVIQPVNGENAKIVGWEFAYQNQSRRLPEPWNGLGVLFNYTWADSEAVVKGLAEKIEFPQQPKNTYNAAVSYEKGRFSTRLSYQFIDKHLVGLGDGPGDTDAFFDEHQQWDFLANIDVTSTIRLYVNMVNADDRTQHQFFQGRFSGAPKIFFRGENYGWWGAVGLRIKFL